MSFEIDIPTMIYEDIDISQGHILTDLNGEKIENCSDILIQSSDRSLIQSFEPLKYGLSPRSDEISYIKIRCKPNRVLKSTNPGNYFIYKFRTNTQCGKMSFLHQEIKKQLF